MRNVKCGMRNACAMLMLMLPFAQAGRPVLQAAGPQTVLDQVVLRFGGEIVTKLDIRQARMLKLVDVSADTDQAYVDAIANRRLMLTDLKRTPPKEPTSEELDAAVRAWAAKVGGGDADTLLDRAGMSASGLRGWIQDDLRMQAYITERFAGRPGDVAAWVSTLRQRAGLR